MTYSFILFYLIFSLLHRGPETNAISIPLAHFTIKPTLTLTILTAVVQAAELEQITVTELHALAHHVAEGRDVGDDGGQGAVAEGVLAVVHHGAVVVRDAQGAGGGVVVGVEVVLLPCGPRGISEKPLVVVF